MIDKDKLARVDIVSVAERLGLTLKRRGKNLMTHCLWHEDKRPSMLVGGKYNRCHCFACDANSDAVGLVMKALNIDFIGACEWMQIRKPHPDPLLKARELKSRIKKLEALQARGTAPAPKGEGRRGAFRNEFLEGLMTMDNSFTKCLKKVFGGNVASDVIRLYKLGSFQAFGRYPDVMFPNIDIHGNILDIKIQAYECDERSERFFHSQREVCYWLKASLLRRNDIDKEKVFKEISPHGDSKDRGFSLFGEHLLPLYPSKIIILVESPKNACVGAARFPQYLWLATGNKGMLKREVLEVLRGRTVVVFPDNDAFDEWQQKLKTMQDIALFSCQHTPGNGGEKGDIADWILGKTL